MGMWRKVVLFLMALVLLGGLGILLYPRLNGWVTDYYMRLEAERFLSYVDTQQTYPTDTTSPSRPIPTGPVPSEPETTIPPAPYPELLQAMQSYNQKIWEQRQVGLCDPWAYTQPSFTLGEYGLQDEVFGVITIPKLDVELPIYLGATNKHMAEGAAHLSQTSIPVGGENTNSVIAGHRGYRGASYFRYITELVTGDEVIITNLWGELHYRVVETKIINPNDVEEILIQENRELVTLLTCHPYASGGRQRWLVICERVEIPDSYQINKENES